MISEDSKSSLRRLMETRTARDEAKRALEVAEAAFRECETDVFDAMTDDGVQGSIKVDLGEPWNTVSFRTRETKFGRIIDEEELLKYVEERQMVDETTAPKFVKKRLNEIVRDHLEQGLKLPPGLDYYTQAGVTITRQKG